MKRDTFIEKVVDGFKLEKRLMAAAPFFTGIASNLYRELGEKMPADRDEACVAVKRGLMANKQMQPFSPFIDGIVGKVVDQFQTYATSTDTAAESESSPEPVAEINEVEAASESELEGGDSQEDKEEEVEDSKEAEPTTRSRSTSRRKRKK